MTELELLIAIGFLIAVLIGLCISIFKQHKKMMPPKDENYCEDDKTSNNKESV